VGITKQELSGYFPEMKALVNDCQFNNCMHINEPGCSVKNAVNEGNIAIDRYVSYMSILDTMNDKKY
jgi:ribosome biogenesis GTPase